MRERIINVLSLFGSSATLLCCALPVTLSIVAGGAAVGSLISIFPWLIPISKHHNWIFLIAGILLMINGIFVFSPKGKVVCSITGGKGCEVAGGFSKAIFWISVTLFGTGFFFAYLYLPVVKFLGVE